MITSLSLYGVAVSALAWLIAAFDIGDKRLLMRVDVPQTATDAGGWVIELTLHDPQPAPL